MNACEMVSRCLRHQCPELLDPNRAAPAEAAVPMSLRYGGGEIPSGGPALAEEPMGAPDAIQW